MRRFFTALGEIALLWCAGFPQSAFAQQRNTAGLYGRVADQQDASVAGVKVTLIQVATGTVHTTLSNDQGEYEFFVLPVGEYRLVVEHPGFKRVEQSGFILQANDHRKVDVSLQLGELNTVVNVTSELAAVETSSQTIKDTVDSQRVVDLPLNGRNLADLTLLVPGVQSANGVSGGQGDGAKRARSVRQFSVNGSRQNNLKYTLDGGDNQDPYFNDSMPFPFPDAVQEFSVETSNSGVEVGKNSGGTVNIVTKSGTNQYHGDVFWFVRNTFFNANNFFSRVPDTLKRNQGGFTVGGPAIKNKLFFFGGYQETWVRATPAGTSQVGFPALHRTGDFSDLLTGSRPVVITDPTSGLPYAGNRIPQSQFSPAAQALLKYAPNPSADGLVHYALPSQLGLQEWIGRGDYRINDKHSVSSRLYWNHDRDPARMLPNNIQSNHQGINTTAENGTVSYTYVARSNLIADTHFTVLHIVGHRTNDFPVTVKDLGVNINPTSNEVVVGINGTSGISLATTRASLYARTNFELTHSWRWIKGRHSLIWGADILASRYNEYNVFQGSGDYQFNGRVTGFDQADFLTGQMSQFRQSNGEIEFRRLKYSGFYGGDSYRMTSRLTLNVGLRWEPFFPMTDLNNRVVQFRQEDYLKGAPSPRFVNSPPGLLYPGDRSLRGDVIPKGGTDSNLGNLAPRVGFAWDIAGNGKTSLRGGYGIFYDTPELGVLNNINDQSPFSFTVQFQSGSFDNPYAGRSQFNVFPFAGDFAPNTPFQIPFAALAVQRKYSQAYVQNWSLTLERQFAGDWTVRAGYVGTKTTQLQAGYDANAPIYDFSQSLRQNQTTLQARRPRAVYQNLTLLFTGLNQSYNSLQISAIRRFSRGLSNQLSYTWSKNIDYDSINDNPNDNQIPNPFNYFDSRSLADNDHRNRFVDSLVWDIPDPGKRMNSRAASLVLGNWETSGIVTLQSGRPVTINSTNDPTAGAGKPRADAIGPVALDTGRSRGAKIAEYFNIANVVQAQPGTFGTLGRNSLIGPGYANVDFTVFRKFPIHKLGEAGMLVFRTEAFNLFNRPQLDVPNTTLGSSAFGRITKTAVLADARILQFSLKLAF